MTHDAMLAEALRAIGKAGPADPDACLYRSGVLDSYDLMQLLLEIEMRSGARLDLAALVERPITLAALEAAVETATAR
ncbi:hypothetical protein GCM10011316_17160 [Roseibium aquae]|uniref:Uncharacterized protein n=1 Tax=Roseibium aquae TaxID=1323746 RepID=A0A916TKI7_9HYPH|nr:hypothetical protein [Roseibium aquae]GGB45659.1 hypothetical protein GCM10011316_17160 [Roseibium aquae]